jgi:hypothetical protein
VELLVQGGNSSEWLLGGTTRARWELLVGASRRNSSEGLLVRGEEYRCEVQGSHANESTLRNSTGTEKQLRQVKFPLENTATQN